MTTRRAYCINASMSLPIKHDPPRGVLGGVLSQDDLDVSFQRWQPPDDLAPFVEHFWSVRWNLRAPIVRSTLPHPSVHWVSEGAKSEIGGIERGRFVRELVGQGRVVSVKFRPGGFCAFYSPAQRTLTGRRIDAAELLGVSATFGRELADRTADKAVLDLAAVLRGCSPQRQERAELAGTIVAAIAADAELTSVARVCDRFGMAPLALQRLFAAKIGIAPKWVIQRYRLHEAIERVHARRDQATDWATLALELGFVDQAHFARTWKAFIGVSPGRYIKELRDSR
jgi:AraC-like DNA-binding protein